MSKKEKLCLAQKKVRALNKSVSKATWPTIKAFYAQRIERGLNKAAITAMINRQELLRFCCQKAVIFSLTDNPRPYMTDNPRPYMTAGGR